MSTSSQKRNCILVVSYVAGFRSKLSIHVMIASLTNFADLFSSSLVNAKAEKKKAQGFPSVMAQHNLDGDQVIYEYEEPNNQIGRAHV